MPSLEPYPIPSVLPSEPEETFPTPPTIPPLPFPTRPIHSPIQGPTQNEPSSPGTFGAESSVCEDMTNSLLDDGMVSSALDHLMTVASSVSFLERCIQDPEFGGHTRRCELDFQTLAGNPNSMVNDACRAAGGHYATVSYRADCYHRFHNGTVSSTPILLYADYNVGSCVASSCDENTLASLFNKQVEKDVSARLQSSGAQSCQVIRVRVTKHKNIFSREEDNSRIANVGEMCLGRTLELLEDHELASNLQNLNALASSFPLTDRCFADLEKGGGIRRCELDYEELDGGDANLAVHQSCKFLEGEPIFVSFSVVCLPLLDNGLRGSIPVLFYIDTNVAACVSPSCSEGETVNFYTYLVQDEVAKKLEAGGSQECDLSTILIENSNDDTIVDPGGDDVETSKSNTEGMVKYGTDSFTMMPVSSPTDIDEKEPAESSNNDSSEIETKVLLIVSAGSQSLLLSLPLMAVATGSLFAISLL